MAILIPDKFTDTLAYSATLKDPHINKFAITTLRIMRNLLEEIRSSILANFAKDKKLLTPPNMTYKSEGKYRISSGNFFFKKPSDIQPTIQAVTDMIEHTIKSHIGSKGEIIKNLIRRGEIWDANKRYFKVKGGAYFESYCFSCNTVTFVRVTWERQLFAPEKEWLSIDIDEIEDPLWLEDSVDLHQKADRLVH
jgi:hypothetical protein